MMRLKIRYFAVLREQRGQQSEEWKTQSATAAEVYRELANKYGFHLQSHQIKVAINDQFVSMDQALKEGDEVVFIAPVAGG